MISDLLDLTRIETGALALQIEPVDLHQAAAQALELVRDIADKAQVALVLATQPGAPTSVLADRTRLRQVLLNLLGNAIKYNHVGGTVELRLAAGADGVAVVTVSDTGVGIAESDLPHVFDPFQRGAQAASGIEGAGIGLAVTRALVELMRGDVAVSSVPGTGSVFTLRLPLAGPPTR